jgi:cold shock CspA family protein
MATWTQAEIDMVGARSANFPNIPVTHWQALSGWGFITPDSGEDLFFHRRDSLAHFDSLSIGTRVRYGTAPSRKYPGKFAAVDVAPL